MESIEANKRINNIQAEQSESMEEEDNCLHPEFVKFNEGCVASTPKDGLMPSLVQMHPGSRSARQDDHKKEDDFERLEFNEEEEEALGMMADLNESAVDAIHGDENDSAMQYLKRAEEVLNAVLVSHEQQQQKGIDIDKNYIVIIYYNLACIYQKMNNLNECVRYLEMAIINMKTKIMQMEKNPFVLQEMSKSFLNTNCQAKEIQLAMKLHKLRYQCKFHLQLCAVLSQLNQHQAALDHGKISTRFCQDLLKQTEQLCRQHIRTLNQQLNTRRKSTGTRDKSNDIQIGSPYGAVGTHESSLQKPKKRKKQTNDSNSSINSSKSHKKLQQELKRGRKRDQQEDEEVNNSRSSSHSISVLIRESVDSESLEKIHTFSLKRSNGDDSGITVDSQEDQKRNSSCGKAFYVEEKVKVMDNHVIQSEAILKELSVQIVEFQDVSLLSTLERNQFFNDGRLGLKKRMRISFGSEQEIERMRKDTRFKLNARNVLGIKHQDDWIFNLNIGNIMHLAPLSFDDLNSFAYIQRPASSGGGLKSVTQTADYLNELHKDTLLEKILFLAVSYFCVGTELRFLSSKQQKSEQNQDNITEPTYTRKDAEIWHGKAMHTVCSFLPSECPLVSHVINSYIKHHLVIKEKERLEKKQSTYTQKSESEEGKVDQGRPSFSPTQKGSFVKVQATTGGTKTPVKNGTTNIKLKKIKDQVENFYKNKPKEAIQRPLSQKTRNSDIYSQSRTQQQPIFQKYQHKQKITSTVQKISFGTTEVNVTQNSTEKQQTQKKKFLSNTLKKKLQGTNNFAKKVISSANINPVRLSNSNSEQLSARADKKKGVVKVRKSTGGTKTSLGSYASTASIPNQAKILSPQNYQQIIQNRMDPKQLSQAQKILVFPNKKTFPPEMKSKTKKKDQLNFYKNTNQENYEVDDRFDSEAQIYQRQMACNRQQQIVSRPPMEVGISTTPPGQQPGGVKNYHFENINVINNVNIYDRQQIAAQQEEQKKGDEETRKIGMIGQSKIKLDLTKVSYVYQFLNQYDQ